MVLKNMSTPTDEAIIKRYAAYKLFEEKDLYYMTINEKFGCYNRNLALASKQENRQAATDEYNEYVARRSQDQKLQEDILFEEISNYPSAQLDNTTAQGQNHSTQQSKFSPRF